MQQGKMYRVRRLADNKLQTAMVLRDTYMKDHNPQLTTENPAYISAAAKYLIDGDVVACLGREMVTTAHYEKQPFYRVLTLAGETGYVSKAIRNKYFELVRL